MSHTESTYLGQLVRRFNGTALASATLCASLGFLTAITSAATASGSPLRAKEKVIIDTDIGIDVDDAFAIALALRNQQLDILGFTTVSGDTAARAKIIDRMLAESNLENIPVAAGPTTTPPPHTSLPANIMDLQGRYGENSRFAKASHRSAVDFIVEQVQRFPGQVTLIAIGPLSNVGALIDKDPASFRKLKRVVMMGGWIAPLESGGGYPAGPPGPEYNILLDVKAAQKLFAASGVPIYVMPLDSTNYLALDEVKRKSVFTQGVPLTDSLALLYILWGRTTPVLYDAMPVAFITDPELCPVKPMRLSVDDRGVTRVDAGTPNAHVCLRSDANEFLDYFVKRIVNTPST